MSSDQSTENSDGKLATGAAPAGFDSITNTVGMHPTTVETAPPAIPPGARRGSCSQPGCTQEHSGRPHE